MENVYPKIYKKAIKGTVGGVTLNNRGLEEEFVLKGDPAKADISQITVEIGSAEADKFFIKNNKPSLVNGYLIEIEGGPDVSFNNVNSVSDGYLKDLLKLPYAKMMKRVGEFTSSVPISRMLTFALDADKPVKTVEALKASLVKLGGSPVVTSTESDSVRVRTIG